MKCFTKNVYHFLCIFAHGLIQSISSTEYPDHMKECVARMTCLYKNNGAVSYVGVDFLFIWSLYLPRTQLLEVGLTRNKKEYLSWLNCGKDITLL